MAFELLGWGLSSWAYMVLAALAGGAFGASIGALPAFCFTGVMVIAGEAANILKGELGGVLDFAAGNIGVGVTGSIAFGPIFGPHISFAGGVAAAAYAAKYDIMQSGFDYHNGKDITYALGTRPDVLAVGGLFGILGLVITRTSAITGFPWDPIAVAVVLSAVVARIVFGYPIVGTARGSGLLDMSPFEREEMRTVSETSTDTQGEATASDGGTVVADRLAVEPWLPHMYKWQNVAAIGLVAGLLGGFIAIETGSAFMAFGISAASLIFLQLGVEQIPVTHHMTLPSSTTALAAMPLGLADPFLIVIAGLFGAYGALVGELVQRIFYAHSDTHFDPPAAAIVVATFTIAVLYFAGLFPSASWIPLP
ncbi:MAG: hypothetical protein ABEI76_08075 [Halobacteriales archaeon]